MAYDEDLADQVRQLLARRKGISEKRMFGGIAFLKDGNMCCGVVNEDVVLRLGPEGGVAALDEPDIRPMDFTGRPMKTMVYLGAPGWEDRNVLKSWVERALAFCSTLPPK